MLVTASQPLPRVAIAGPPELEVPSGAALRLHGLVSLSACFDDASSAALGFRWGLMGRHDIARWGRESPFSPTAVLQWDEARRDPRHAMYEGEHNQTLPGLEGVNTSRRTLHLPAGLLQPAATYIFAFTAFVIDAEAKGSEPELASTAYVRVAVRSEVWQPRIAGCDRLVGSTERVSLRLATLPQPGQQGASSSFGWVCSPAPCAAPGTALAAQLEAAGAGRSASEASLNFLASDMLAHPAGDMNAARSMPAEFTFVLVSPRPDQPAVDGGIVDVAAARCTQRMAARSEQQQQRAVAYAS